MKKIQFINILFIYILCLFIFFQACKKNEDSKETTTDELIAQQLENTYIDELYDEIYNEADNGINTLFNLKKKDIKGCPTITIDKPVDDQAFPKIITIDYGTSGCKGRYDKIRKGKLMVSLSENWRLEGGTRTITFENFSIEDNKIEGTKIITNNGENSSGHPQKTIELKSGKVTTSEGKIITREFVRVREWIDGYSTPFILRDDVYNITGNASGTNSSGRNYSNIIKTPLEIAFDCFWIRKGVIESTYTKGTETKSLSIDYGDGTCDSKALVTINGETKEISLR